MGLEVSEALKTVNEVGLTILKCLIRDPDWVAYHASELAEAARAAPVDELALRVAAAERKAFRLQRLGQYENALNTLEKLIGDETLARDAQRRAWVAALAARAACQIEDEAKGQRLQTVAFSVNNNHTPPRIRPVYVPRAAPGKQAAAIVSRLREYDQRAAMVVDFEAVVADLVPEASPSRYEEALADLGNFLGFDAERPEKIHLVGPDVLWRTEAAFDFVIEAKSEKGEDSPLYKKDHAQLLEAEHWFKQAYPGREAVRVSALPEAVADEKATPVGSFALRLAEVTKLVSALRGVLVELVGATGGPEALRDQCEAALVKAQLKPNAIRATFMKPFGKATPPRA
jgi:replicative superfamily II helicase